MECAYFEICGLQAVRGLGGKQFCWIHLPDPNKNEGDLNYVIRQYLAAGKADFRYAYFHGQVTPPFAEVTFPTVADFRDAVFPAGELRLYKAHLPKGLFLSVENLFSLDMQEVTSEGSVVITVTGSLKSLNANAAHLSKELTITVVKATTLSLQGAVVGAKVVISGVEEIGEVSLHEARLSGGLELTSEKLSSLTVGRATVEGAVSVKINSGTNVQLPLSKFQGDLSLHATDFQGLNLGWSELSASVSLRGRFQSINFSMATVKGTIAVQNSELNVSRETFNGTRFEASSALDLSGSSLRGDFRITGSSVPSAICLDACQIAGTTTIRGPLGSQAPHIIAEKHRPQFGAGVSLANVDLGRCKLVGNSIREMDLADIRWAHRWGRNVLYDEVAVRTGAPIPFGSLKEAYQLLKEKYRDMGDHATAGDFHYGEMEMRRRGYGWPRRLLCPEFLYWALSGYGTGYARAFLLLLFFVLLFSGLYFWSNPAAFGHQFSEALLFSVQVSTLQRPALPEQLNELGRWFHAAEVILGPVQIALLVLALRMRLKR